MVNAKKETCVEFVRRVWGECTEDEADSLLWNCTAFPMASVEHVEKQLLQAKVDSGGIVGLAMQQADEVVEKAMKSMNEPPAQDPKNQRKETT